MQRGSLPILGQIGDVRPATLLTNNQPTAFQELERTIRSRVAHAEQFGGFDSREITIPWLEITRTNILD